MTKLLDVFLKTDKMILKVLRALCIIVFAVLAVLMTATVFVRFFPIFSIHWTDEIIELLFAALVFYGSAAAWIKRDHFSAGDWISPRLPSERLAGAYRLLIELSVLAFLVLFSYCSIDLVSRAHDTTNMLSIPKKALYFCLPVSGCIMTIYSVKNVFLAVVKIISPSSIAAIEKRAGACK